MAKMFAICRMAGGQPDLDLEVTPVHGWALADQLGQYGAYLFSGTGQQLLAVNALPQCLGIVGVTSSGDVRWPELDGALPENIRTKLNIWADSMGLPNVPDGWDYRRTVKEVFKRFNDKFDINSIDISESE